MFLRVAEQFAAREQGIKNRKIDFFVGPFALGEKSRIIVKLLWVAMIVVGSQTTLGFAWDLADTINGLMIIPNLVGLILLSGEVVKLKNEYLGQRLPVHK